MESRAEISRKQSSSKTEGPDERAEEIHEQEEEKESVEDEEEEEAGGAMRTARANTNRRAVSEARAEKARDSRKVSGERKPVANTDAEEDV